MNVTLCIPSVPGRRLMLQEAFASATEQVSPLLGLPLSFTAIHVEVDTQRRGPAATRNAAVRAARTEWVAFLDDDDLLTPHHLGTLLARQEDTGADLVYPWFHLEVSGRRSNRRQIWITRADGSQKDPEGAEPELDALDVGNFIPVTTLVRREMLLDVGGFQPAPRNAECEDWGAWLALRDAGATFAHVPERTWVWRQHGGNFGGRVW